MPQAPNDPCRELRLALLDLHRALLELERRQYEKWHGVQSSGDFLQVVAFSDEMRWLEPLSRLIVMLDEALELDGDPTLTPQAVAGRLRELLQLDRSGDGSFPARYTAHFDTAPELVHRHARLMAVLKQWPAA
jgi:hypothetical protein